MLRLVTSVFGVLLLGSGCADYYLRSAAVSALECPESKVKVTKDFNSARAEGCGRLVLFDRICSTGVAMVTTTSSGSMSPGRLVQRCGYTGRHYSCSNTYEPGTWQPGQTTTQPTSVTQCNWVARRDRWRRDDVHEDARPAPHEWDRRYRPSPTPRASSAAAPSAPSAPETQPDTPKQVTIADLGDLAKADGALRSWIGQPVRLALVDGTAFEGVLQYVRSYTLWFTDGARHRLEDVLAAERF